MTPSIEGGGCKECQRLRARLRVLRKENRILKECLASIEAYSVSLRWFKPSVKHPKKRKKPGRHEGHIGAGRHKPDHVDETVAVTLDCCPQCGSNLGKSYSNCSRYVWDVPPPTAVKVTEYRIHRYWCRHCRRSKEAQPCQLPYFRLDLGAWEWAYVMHHQLNVSFDKITWWMREVWQLPVTKSALTQGLDSLGKQLTPAYDGMMLNLKTSRYSHTDETSCRVNGANWWTWIFRTQNQIIYHTEGSRGGEVPKKILGEEYNGVIVTDDFSAYHRLKCQKQACWVHLIRKARDLCEMKKPHPEHRQLHRHLQRVFHDIKEYQKKPPPPDERLNYYLSFERRLKRIIKKNYRTKGSKVIAERIQRRLPEYLTCILQPDIPPQNNPAEQGLRHQVIHRKNSNIRGETSMKTHDILNTLLATQLQTTPNPLEATHKILTQLTTTN